MKVGYGGQELVMLGYGGCKLENVCACVRDLERRRKIRP